MPYCSSFCHNSAFDANREAQQKTYWTRLHPVRNSSAGDHRQNQMFGRACRRC